MAEPQLENQDTNEKGSGAPPAQQPIQRGGLLAKDGLPSAPERTLFYLGPGAGGPSVGETSIPRVQQGVQEEANELRPGARIQAGLGTSRLGLPSASRAHRPELRLPVTGEPTARRTLPKPGVGAMMGCDAESSTVPVAPLAGSENAVRPDQSEVPPLRERRERSDGTVARRYLRPRHSTFIPSLPGRRRLLVLIRPTRIAFRR